jgi:RNA polymerase sigma-70 factor (ECF subfamily)
MKNRDADTRPLEWEDNTYRPDDLFRKRHLKSQVDSAVDQLPEHHRTVFVLREMEGKTYEEIAEITSTNLGTVKSRLNRARNNFAQLIAPLLD